ncbi:hypothetical protein HF086_014986, partial [Spodoptera exigua]
MANGRLFCATFNSMSQVSLYHLNFAQSQKINISTDPPIFNTIREDSPTIISYLTPSFQILDVYMPDNPLSIQAACALTLVPLVLICQIRNLKYLVPFSALANLLILVVFVITIYYVFLDLPSPKEREMVASITQWPLFLSTVIFAMEGIGVVMPVENEMAKPQQFLGCPGVLNVAMVIVISLYGFVGFFGYL